MLCLSFSIYEKLIQFCSIDELGTNYPKDMFDPHGWSEDSYYEALGEPVYFFFFFFFAALCDNSSDTDVCLFTVSAKAQKVEMDKLEKAKKERTKVRARRKREKKRDSRLICCQCCVRGKSPPAAVHFYFTFLRQTHAEIRLPNSALLSVQLRPNPSPLPLCTSAPCPLGFHVNVNTFSRN